MEESREWESLRGLVEQELRGSQAQLAAAASGEDALQAVAERLARQAWAAMAVRAQPPLRRSTWRTWWLLRRYRALSLSGRLAVALVVLHRWLAAHRLHDEDVQALLEHQWLWLTVGPGDSFDAWHEADVPLLDTALAGVALPQSTRERCLTVGADADRLALLLTYTVAIVEGSLFSAAHDEESLRSLGVVLALAAEDGVSGPPAAWFARLLRQDRHGWGVSLSAEELHQLRARTSV
ncbi:hypothetical protein CLV92_115116 [Kineococcus xinjiangensis]|uniref:Uncharacterized protein n=1 Tax=Kineococcus xinjiangensis TaxID=512762 RepID=A0A2S6IDX8_9ACTN|nr:hypothetical protein [Kineococcus xinjiangensis]PPK92370.1 hypothetical protein CLV92_115116 [Kineococcus xinjiangensis]